MGRIVASEDARILIPGTRGISRGRKGFADVIGIRDLETGRFFWTIWGAQCDHKSSKSQRRDVMKRTENQIDVM